MEFSNEFDKINVPIYICSPEWKVIYRNKVCKKYTSSPRLNSDMSRVFIEKQNGFFPDSSRVYLLCCNIKNTYKTAVCFNYHGNAAVLFSSLFEYDILFGDIFDRWNKEFADCLVRVFDSVSCKSDSSVDKYGVIEKIRNYTFSAIDNYVALSYFDSEKRSRTSVTKLCRLLGEKLINIVGKAGYKVEAELSKLDAFCENIYVDTAYFSMVFSSFLLFCLGVSPDKKCIVSACNVGTRLRTEFAFSCNKDYLYGKHGKSLHDLMEIYPIEYLNVMAFEDICKAICWECGYSVSKADMLNAKIYFEIDVDGNATFNSVGSADQLTAERLVSDVFEYVSFVL